MQTAKLSRDEFELFQQLLIRESGLFFDLERKYILEEALGKRLKQLNCPSLRDYFSLLNADNEGRLELKELFDTLTIGETYFMRNPDQFEVFKNFVLSRMEGRKEIKIWSAGCATGEEPYTIAMILLETLKDPAGINIKIAGTDINRRFLSSAREGLYSQKSVKELPPEYLKKYFSPDGNQFRLKNRVKQMVKFFYHNLARDSFYTEDTANADIIFCRNVVIYFDPETVKRVIENLFDVMNKEGYLFCGHAEVLWKINQKFKSIEFPHTFIYQKELYMPPEEPLPFVDVPELKAEYKVSEEEIAAEEKPDLSVKIAKAVELSNQAKYNEAIAGLLEIIGEDNLTVYAYYLLGVLFTKIGKMEDAVQQFRKALYINPELDIIYYNLGNIYLYKKELEKARREYQNAINILEKKKPEEPVSFSESLNNELLLIACRRSLDKIAPLI